MRSSPAVALVFALLAAGAALNAQGGDSDVPRRAVERELIALTERNIRTHTNYNPAFADSVVTGVWQFAGMNNGIPRAGRLRFTTVWVQRDHRWREVSWQGTPIAPSLAEGPAGRSTSDGEAEIRRLESLDWQRFQSVQRADVRALDTLLAPDWVASGSSERLITKKDYLSELASGKRWYGDMKHEDVLVRILGDAALITGRSTGPVRFRGVERVADGRFTHV